MKIIADILSYTGLLLAIITYLIKGKDMLKILILIAACNFCMAMSYLLLGNFPGALSSLIGMIVGIINSCFNIRQKELPRWLIVIYAIAFISVNIATFSSWKTIFALAATLSAVFSLCAKTGLGYRLWSLSNDAFWMIFDASHMIFAQFFTHSVLAVFAISGILIHDIKKKKETK